MNNFIKWCNVAQGIQCYATSNNFKQIFFFKVQILGDVGVSFIKLVW